MLGADNTFFLLNKRTDWDKGQLFNLTASERGLCLQQETRYVRVHAVEWHAVEELTHLTDLTLGDDDKLYLLDQTTALWVYDYTKNHTVPLFGADHGMFTSQASIATAGSLLLVGDPHPDLRRRLAAYSTTNGQLLWSLRDWRDQEVYPLAVTADRGENTYVLLPEHTFSDASGQVLVRENSKLVLVKLDRAGIPSTEWNLPITFSVDTPLKRLHKRYELTVVGENQLCVVDTERRDVHLIGTESSLLEEARSWLAASGNTGGDKLWVDAKRNLYLWKRGETGIRVMALQVSTKQSESGQFTGTYVSHALDSQMANTRWHKLVFDAELDEDTQLQVSYYASDHLWSDPDWSDPIANPRDALVRAQGQYLWLRIQWIGSSKHSPLLKQLRVEFPRISYLNYLPGVYQEDEQSRDFLERFLAMFRTFYDEMEDQIDHISAYFDADAVSGEYLKWLASWMGIAADANWTEEETRRLLKQAPRLYLKRGTRQGLQEMLEIFLGEKPEIIEYFQYKELLQQPEARAYLAKLYGLNPFQFCVVIRPGLITTDDHLQKVQKIVQTEKPAFTEARLILLQPGISLGTHTYLDVNTVLSPAPIVLGIGSGDSSMLYNTVLIDVDNHQRMGDQRSRLGFNTVVE